MPSRLREQTSFDQPISILVQTSPSQPPQKKQKMSLSQTYFVASSARSKLGKEACRPDHNLRLLVGHANLLDSLMLELREAEREQEAWFNQSIKKAQKADEPRHVQCIDTISEEEEAEDDDSDADSEFDESDFEMTAPLRRLRSPPVTISSTEIDSDEDAYEDDEYSPELALTRTESHPPELVHDSDSDDESPPASPPQPTFEYDSKAAAINLNLLGQAKLGGSGFVSIIPENNAPLIEAY